MVLARSMRSLLRMHGIERRIVYILRSDPDPARHCVGLTNDVHERLDWHNHRPADHRRTPTFTASRQDASVGRKSLNGLLAGRYVRAHRLQMLEDRLRLTAIT
jgi:hypothetical protein